MNVSDVLVPIDFSPNSLQAIKFATQLVDAEGEVYLLHVLDADFVKRVSDEGFQTEEAALEMLRKRATERMDAILSEHAGKKMEKMIVVGKPFAEILRVAMDLDFEMIVLGTHGRLDSDLEQLLFGSTAEKILRGTHIPVVCVPFLKPAVTS